MISLLRPLHSRSSLAASITKYDEPDCAYPVLAKVFDLVLNPLL